MTPDELRDAIDQATRAVDEAARRAELLRNLVRGDRLSCVECRLAWSDEPDSRFRAYLTGDDADDVVLLCPECAEQEFA